MSSAFELTSNMVHETNTNISIKTHVIHLKVKLFQVSSPQLKVDHLIPSCTLKMDFFHQILSSCLRVDLYHHLNMSLEVYYTQLAAYYYFLPQEPKRSFQYYVYTIILSKAYVPYFRM